MRELIAFVRSRSGRHWHARSALIGSVLLVTLAVTVALAYQSQRTTRSHRETAEGVLRDYATFATGELTRRAERELYQLFATQLSRLASACDGRPRPPTLEEWALVKDS